MPVSTTGRPAAVLSILVTANTRTAQAQMAALDRQMAYTVKGTNRAVSAMKFAGVGIAAGLAGSVAAAISFQQEFAGVKKTIQASPQQFKTLRKGILDLSTVIPESANSLADLAAEAGALGVKADQLKRFTKIAAELGTATNLTAVDAADSLARLGNIMQQRTIPDFEKMGSTLVALGNKGASTESEISTMALRIAGAGKQVGLTAAQVLGLGAALSNVGIRAEMGGSAISRVLLAMQSAIAVNGKELEVWAKTAGMSTKEFADTFKKDPTAAIADFAAGLDTVRKSGGDIASVLTELGKAAHTSMNEIRVRDTLLRVAGNTDAFTKSMGQANKAWDENNALQKEFTRRQHTLESQLTLLKNGIARVAIEIGSSLMPNIRDMVKILSNPHLTLAQKVEGVMSEIQQLLEQAIGVVGPIGGQIMEALVVGMVKAWWQSDLLGKLFISTAFIRLIGGPGALAKLGVALGTKIGATMGLTMATEAAAASAAATAGGAAAGTTAGAASSLAVRGSATGMTMGVAQGAAAAGAGAAEASPGLLAMAAAAAPVAGLATAVGGVAIGLGLLNSHLNDVRDSVDRVEWANLADKMDRITNATHRFHSAAKKVPGAVKDWKKANEANEKASERVTRRQHQLTAAVKQYGPKSRQAARAEDRLSEARKEHRKTANAAARSEQRLSRVEENAQTNQLKLIRMLQRIIPQQRKKLKSDVASYNMDVKAQAPRKKLIADLLAIAGDQKDLKNNQDKLRKANEKFFGVQDKGTQTQKQFSQSLKDNSRQFKAVNPFIQSTTDKTLHYGNVLKDTSIKGTKSIDNLETGTTKGIQSIGDKMTAQFKALGVSNPAKFGIITSSSSSGSTQKKASGGKVGRVPGHTGGDRHTLSIGGVPIARVESGEDVFVGNRTMSNALGELNRAVPRRASGGIIAAGHLAQQMGLTPTENPAFGGVTAGAHAPGSYHYSGQAIDVIGGSGPGSGQWANFVGAVRRGWLGKGLAEQFYDLLPNYVKNDQIIPGQFGDHADHVHVAILGAAMAGAMGLSWKNIKAPTLTGPDGAMKGLGQGGLDRITQAANKFGRKLASKMGGVSMEKGLGSYDMGSLEKLWRASGSGGDPHLMAAIAMAESGGNPQADNGIARGLWQIISSTWSAYGKGSWDNAFNPNMNAQAAHRVLAGSGLGAWDTYTSGAYQQFMQKGGLAWGGWHGQGGTIHANRPTLIGIGERGAETATVTPAGRTASTGPLRLVGELKIKNWKDGTAHFEGIADEAVNGQRRLGNQMGRMSRA